MPPSQLATAAVPVLAPSATDTQAVATLPAVARKQKVDSDRALGERATMVAAAIRSGDTAVPIKTGRTQVPANDIGLLETMIPTGVRESADEFDIDLTESVEGVMPPLPMRRTIRAPAFDELSVTTRINPWMVASCVLAVLVIVLAVLAFG